MSKYFQISDFMDESYSTLFVLGARGVGKTVSTLTYYIKHCYGSHQKFIYLRRYQSEIDTLGFNFQLFSDITGLDVTQEVVKDDTGRKALMITANGQAVGYLLALSVAGKYKSNDYTGTAVIIYDEFIDIRGRELKNEINLFLNFSMTVFRDFTKYRAIFLANATNLFNAYFVGFNAFPKSKITRYKKLGIKIVMYQTTAELNKRDSTDLAKLVTYAGDASSSLDNHFAQQSGFIAALAKKAKCLIQLKSMGEIYGYWSTPKGVIISAKYDPSTKRKISIDDLDEGYIYDPAMQAQIAMLLAEGRLCFDTERTRGVWLKLLKEKRLI